MILVVRATGMLGSLIARQLLERAEELGVSQTSLEDYARARISEAAA